MQTSRQSSLPIANCNTIIQQHATSVLAIVQRIVDDVDLWIERVSQVVFFASNRYKELHGTWIANILFFFFVIERYAALLREKNAIIQKKQVCILGENKAWTHPQVRIRYGQERASNPNSATYPKLTLQLAADPSISHGKPSKYYIFLRSCMVLNKSPTYKSDGLKTVTYKSEVFSC